VRHHVRRRFRDKPFARQGCRRTSGVEGKLAIGALLGTAGGAFGLLLHCREVSAAWVGGKIKDRGPTMAPKQLNSASRAADWLFVGATQLWSLEHCGVRQELTRVLLELHLRHA